MNALIVCQAGPQLGLGHLTRSLVVARALHRELGAGACLLVQGAPIRRADLGEYEHHFVGGEEDLLGAIRRHAKRIDASVVVLDLHPCRVPADIGTLLDELRQGSCRVIGVDGLLERRDKLDLVFIPSFHFAPQADSGGAAPILSGWDCYLLNVDRAPREWRPGARVLALTGGSDAAGLGRTLPTLLDNALRAGSEVHWVTGPYAQAPVWPAAPRLRMLRHQSPAGLGDLMVEANYAVTVYGVSFFELLYYGVPTVVFSPYGDKDAAELAAIGKLRVALVAADEAQAVGRLKDLMADDELAAGLSRRARQRMSAPGGAKFARAVAQLFD